MDRCPGIPTVGVDGMEQVVNPVEVSAAQAHGMNWGGDFDGAVDTTMVFCIHQQRIGFDPIPAVEFDEWWRSSGYDAR